jgi:hypothetical protein
VRKFSIPVDKEKVIASNAALPTDNILPELKIDLSSKNYLLRGDLVILSVIATTNFNRPVCFTSAASLRELGLDKYVRQEGLTYRFVPVMNNGQDVPVNNQVAYDNLMNKFRYASAGKKGVYYDEENRRRMNYMRLGHAQIAMSLAEAGEKAKAKQVLRRFDSQYDNNAYPYGMTSRANQHNAISAQYLLAAYSAGDKELARKINASIKKDLAEQLVYYQTRGDQQMSNEQLAMNALAFLKNESHSLADSQLEFANDILSSYQLLRQIQEWEKQFN